MEEQVQVNTGSRRIIVIISITLGMLLAALDTMIMSTAMPEIKERLGNFSLYSWVFSAYMLSSTITVPLYGKLADMYGRKKVYSVALTIFIIGSALCGMADTMLQLVLFRAIQGLGAGGVIPLTVTIAGDLYSVEQRGKIQGLFSSMWALSGIAGPVVGGWIIQNWHWSWIFWINIPVGILAIAGFLMFRDQVAPVKQKIDYKGAAILALAVLSFLLTTIVESGWMMLVFFILSGLLSFLFTRFERKQSNPLIRVDFFADPMLKWVNITAFIVSMGLFAIPSFIPLFAQDVMGYSPLVSGLVLMAQVAGWNSMSILSGKLIVRFGYKPLVVVSISLLLLGGVVLLSGGYYLVYTLLIVALFILGMTTFIIAVQEAVSPAERGISTSIQMFFRNVGAALGVSLVGAVMNVSSNYVSLGKSFLIVFMLSILITMLALAAGTKVPRSVQEHVR